MKTRPLSHAAATSLAALVSVLVAPLLRAQSGLSLIKIADTATPIPSASGTFASFGPPGRSGGVTGIFGTRFNGITDLRGIYRLDSLGLARVADTTMSAPPAASGSIFTEMRDVSTWNGDTAFWASYAGGDGVFLHSGGTLRRVADRTSLNPSAGHPAFSFLGPYVSTSGGAVSFQGSSSVSGNYFANGVGGISLIADTVTAIPSGTGNFTSLGKPSLDAGATAFHGFGSSSQGGIYVHDGASLSRGADKTTAFPSGTGIFTEFGDPVQDAGRTLFYGSGTVNQQAIVLANGGALQMLVSKATPMPSGTANIFFFSSSVCAISGNNVAFIARDPGGADSLCIYTGATGTSALIQRTSSGVTTPVVQLDIGPESLDGKVVVFRAGTVLYSAEVSSYARNVSGLWDTAANWSFNETPGSSASVLISGAAAFTVTGPAQPAAVRTLEILSIDNTPGAVNFQLQPGGPITAADGAAVRFSSTLSGEGALSLGVGKDLTVFGFIASARATIAPGNAGVGTLTFGTAGNGNRVIIGNFSTLRSDYNSAGQCDRIIVRGDLDLSATSDSLALTALSAATGSYVLGTYSGALTGTFNSVSGLPAGYSVDYSIAGRILLRSTNPDSDGDGIPDVWELTFALDLATLTATGDADHDGEPDAAEYITDTDPLDPVQKFRITQIGVTSAPTTHQLTWTSRPACRYRIESVIVLGAPWQLRLDNIPPDGPTTTRALPLPPEAAQFYRVVAFRVP